MITRIERRFADLKRQGRAALVTTLLVGIVIVAPGVILVSALAREMPQVNGHRSCASLVARFAEPYRGAGAGEGDAHLNDREHR